MIVTMPDINSLARSRGPDSLAVVTSVSLPNVPLRVLPKFPGLPKEIGAYATGSGLAEGPEIPTLVCWASVIVAGLLLWNMGAKPRR